jgi:hypothetical protein
MSPEQLRLQSALAALERNRALIRARFMPDTEAGAQDGKSKFPRSATFRWLMAAVGNRRLVGAALQAVLGKYPVGRMLAAWVMNGGSR